MSVDWQRVLPVIISICIIIAVAILRQYSKSFAAIAATMPINIPLALWIAYNGDHGDRESMVQFAQSLMLGLPPTFVFIVAAWLAARAGLGLVPMLVIGYAAWLVALLATYGIRSLLMR
jgi:hypothetical protein